MIRDIGKMKLFKWNSKKFGKTRDNKVRARKDIWKAGNKMVRAALENFASEGGKTLQDLDLEQINHNNSHYYTMIFGAMILGFVISFGFITLNRDQKKSEAFRYNANENVGLVN